MLVTCVHLRLIDRVSVDCVPHVFSCSVPQTSISHATGPMYSPQSTAVLGVLAAIVLAILAPVR